ncbi:MAG: DnaA/Hda family protein, partial [Chlamydiota bacterium]
MREFKRYFTRAVYPTICAVFLTGFCLIYFKSRESKPKTEQFVQEFLDAIRYKKNTDFAGYYRGADVLIVDDMQFIAGKEKTQEEFFHTFNALHQA